jgi:hypothetical protein
MGRSARSLRGFLVHDERIDLAHIAPNNGTVTGSSYTQAGSKPGNPVPVDARGTWLVHASNGQDADLDVRVVRAGAPKIDGAGALYRESGEANESYRGWCEPNLITGYVPVEVTTTEDWLVADACTIPSSQKVVAVAADQDAVARESVSTWTWDPATRTWGARIEPDSANTRTQCAIVCLSENERVIVFQCTPASGSVFAHYSDDAGATWAEYSNPMKAGTIDGTVDRIRVVEDASGALLLLAADDATGNWWLYRSDDAGMTFVLSDSGAAWGSKHSMARLSDGRILVAYVENGTLDAKSIVLEDAFDTITGTTGTSIDGTTNLTNLEIVVDDDGIAYAVLRVAGSAKWMMARSTDNASTWTVYTHNPMGVGSAGTPADHVHQLWGLSPSGGELVALVSTTHVTAPASDGSLLSLVLGGWASMEQGDATGLRTGRFSFGSDTGTAGDSSVYTAGETFANHGWVPTGTGETRTGGYHRFNTAAATGFATLTTAYPSGGIETLLVEVRVVSGGSTTTDAAEVSHSRNDGANGRGIKIRSSTTQFAVWDSVAGTQIGATVTVDMTTLMQFLIVCATSTGVSVFYKRPSDSIWLLAAQKDPLSGGVTVSTNQVLVLGVGTASTTDMRVGLLAWGAHAMERGLVLDSFNVDKLRWGKSLGARPYPVRDQGAALVTRLAGSGGPGRLAEQISIPAAYDHGVRELLPQESPSPASRWRSTTTASDQWIAWDLRQNTRLGQNWSLALALVGANFSQAILEVQADGAGAWTTIGTWSSVIGTGLRYQRTGDLIVPDTTGGSAPAYWPSGWLAGGLVSLSAGTALRRIRTNSAGGWGPDGSIKASLLLDGITGAEPANGTLSVAAPSGVLVVHERTLPFRYIRIRIPVQNVAESYFELGQVLLGAVCAPGRQWSRGWSWLEDQQLDLEEDDRGTLWAGAQRRPRRRELTVSWQDGYDLTEIRSAIDPPYLSASPGSTPLVADQDVWWALSGMLLAAQGGALPVCALAEIPQSSGMVTDPSMFLPGRLTGRFQVNNVQGREGRDEVYRAESLTVVELV